MAVVASAQDAANAAPSSAPDSLWALAYLFSADWSNGMKIHESFITDIGQSIANTEQRRGMVLSPARLIEVDLLLYGAEQVGYFRAFLNRAAVTRFLFPLYCDQTFVTAAAGSVLTCSTTDKRFFAGAAIAVVSFNDGIASFTTAQISSLNATTITCAAGPVFSSTDVGKYVFPLIEAELLLDQTATILNDQTLSVSMSVKESRGAYSLDALQAIGSNPGGVSYLGYPVLTIDPDMEDNSFGIRRQGEVVTVGRGNVFSVYGSQAQALYELNFKQLDRTSAVALIRWFEAMGGRLKPFFLLSPLTDWQAVSFTGTSVTVKSSMVSSLDFAWTPYIGVRMRDGSVQIRLIDSVLQSGDNYEITVATAWSVTPTLTTMARLSMAHLVRFDTDEIVEEWLSDGVLISSLSMIEVWNEASITIADIKDFTLGYA